MKVTLGSKKRPHWTLRHCLRKIKLIDQKKKNFSPLGLTNTGYILPML